MILAFVAVLLGLAPAGAEIQAPVRLWGGEAPGALGASSNDVPTLTAYLPEATNATHTAMLILPGGGYANLDLADSANYACWLNGYGVTCFVLKYRVSSDGYHYPAMIDDGTRAVRWVRAHAGEYHLNPHHIGLTGVSAGGHLGATLATHFDGGNPKSADAVERQSSRPDFAVLCYPVITMAGEFANQDSRRNLLGADPPTKLVRRLSDESQVKYDTPPCFLWTSMADEGVPMENALMFAEALRRNGVRFELHVYERGGHGDGLAGGPLSTSSHMGLAEIHSWLKEHLWAN